ncbi:bifunctional protein-disulfide isomerase/oxidoreductase DsbC [Alteromonas lipolytica]
MFLASSLVQAAQSPAEIEKKIESTIGFAVDAVAESPVEGLYQVSTSRGLFYVSNDGKYLLQARVFNMDAGMRNETEETLTTMRINGVQKYADTAVTFPAEDEKYVISVFTDITCGYCRKLHSEIEEFNDLGITVRYLAFPRAGLDSKTYEDMVSVWCAEDPQEAMTEAKAGESVPSASCKNTVAEQYRLGQRLGVNGTPNIILPDGSLVPGYQPASAIAQVLSQN